jgi:serine/threonine protein kinase
MSEYSVPATKAFSDDDLPTSQLFYGKYRYEQGEEIGGRFHVHDCARGGFGEVYFCYDREREYFYALKTFRLSQKALDDPFTLARLRHEVDKWIALGEHEHVVQCFALEVIDNVPFLLLEWITDDAQLCRHYEFHHQDSPMLIDWYARLGRRGLSLRKDEASRSFKSAGATLYDWIQTYKKPPLWHVLQLTLDICAGLLHAQRVQPGFVHCDLKSSNILVTGFHRAKVTDFGTVRIAQEVLDLDLPRGTEAYMAPEQWRGEMLDARADIYAIGCTLFEMLTGSPPFGYNENEPGDLCYKHEHTAPPPLGDDIPESVKEIVQRCLQKDPQDRFSSLEEMSDVLTKTFSSLFARVPSTVIETKPQGVEEINQEGITYYNLGKYEEALASFERAIKRDGVYPNTYTNRGCVYHVMGQHEAALADYAQAVRLGRRSINAKVRNNRGLLYVVLNQPERALKDLYEAISIDSQYANAYVNVGLAHLLLDNHGEALQRLGKAIALNPKQVLAYHNRGFVYQQLGHVEDALRDYREALLHDPFLIQSYINRSLLYIQLGRSDEAEEDYKQIERLGSKNAADQNYQQAAICLSRPDPQLLNVESLDSLIVSPFINDEREKRRWQEIMGEHVRPAGRMPLHSQVVVKRIDYSVWLHKSVQRRQEQGERLTQVTADVEVWLDGNYLEKPLFQQCELLLDEQTIRELDRRYRTIQDLQGCRMHVVVEDPDDPQRPLRIQTVLY